MKSVVNANTIMTAVASQAQAYSGSLSSDIPGARRRRMEIVNSAPAATPAISAAPSPTTQKSIPLLANAGAERGVYANQPMSATASNKNPEKKIKPLNRKTQ